MAHTLEQPRRQKAEKTKAEDRAKRLDAFASRLDGEGKIPKATPTATDAPKEDVDAIWAHVNYSAIHRLWFVWDLLHSSREVFYSLRVAGTPLAAQFSLFAEAVDVWTQDCIRELRDFAKKRPDACNLDSREARLLESAREYKGQAEGWADVYSPRRGEGNSKILPSKKALGEYPQALRRFSDNSIGIVAWKPSDKSIDPLLTPSLAEEEKRKGKIEAAYLGRVKSWAKTIPAETETSDNA